jgi:hypothetical protein
MALLAFGLVVAAVWPARQVWAVAGDQGTRLTGDPAAVQRLQNTFPPARRERWRRAISTLGWKIGLAVLACAAASTSAFSLRQGELVPTTPLAISFLTLWLAGCALAVWNRRPTRWAIVSLALVALVMLVLQPPAGLAPIV